MPTSPGTLEAVTKTAMGLFKHGKKVGPIGV